MKTDAQSAEAPADAPAEAVNHPIFARLYMALPSGAEDRFRAEMLEGVRGDVIEIGAGHGPNFPFYAAGQVSRVVAVEPEPVMRRKAVEAAAGAPVPIEVVDGTASALPADNETFDVVVCSLMLCSVPDQGVALAEARRVLKSGGELRFYEHVVSDRPRLARLQRMADATVWPKFTGGCHMARDTGSAIEAAGFEILESRRFGVPGVMPVAHILGRARKV